LNTAEDAVEPELCLMVHRLAGGEVFWTREIISFIGSFGSDDFMQHFMGSSGGDSTMFIDRAPTAMAQTVSGIAGTSPARTSVDHACHDIGHGGPKKKTLMQTFLTGWGSAAEEDSATSHSEVDDEKLTRQRRYDASIHGQSHESSVATHYSNPEAKLEFLVVCRMARLAPQVANIAKTAAILGEYV
jgi:hypothetical protein